MTILILSSHTPSLFWFRMDMMHSFLAVGAKVFAVGNESEEKWKLKFEGEGIKYLSIPVSRNGLNVLGDIKTFNALRKIINAEHPDKIFTYQAKTIVYGIFAAHWVDKSILNYPLVAGLGSIFRGTSFRSKIVRSILSLQYKLAFKYSIKVIFQNNDDKKELLRRGLLKETQTEMINGSGVSLEKFAAHPLPDKKAILFIGRLIRDKGVGEYLELAKRIKKCYPEVRCLLVGPYDSNPSAIKPDELQPLIDANIIEYFGEQSDVRPYINECTVYVLPSYHEGTPKTVLEAMATGRPIVTTDAPGCRETVIDGVNGFLVPVQNIDELEKAVIKILNDAEVAKQFGRNSRKIAEDKYDVNKVNASILKVMGL